MLLHRIEGEHERILKNCFETTPGQREARAAS
jgi:hypothetical protein